MSIFENDRIGLSNCAIMTKIKGVALSVGDTNRKFDNT